MSPQGVLVGVPLTYERKKKVLVICLMDQNILISILKKKKKAIDCSVQLQQSRGTAIPEFERKSCCHEVTHSFPILFQGQDTDIVNRVIITASASTEPPERCTLRHRSCHSPPLFQSQGPHGHPRGMSCSTSQDGKTLPSPCSERCKGSAGSRRGSGTRTLLGLTEAAQQHPVLQEHVFAGLSQ